MIVCLFPFGSFDLWLALVEFYRCISPFRSIYLIFAGSLSIRLNVSRLHFIHFREIHSFNSSIHYLNSTLQFNGKNKHPILNIICVATFVEINR